MSSTAAGMAGSTHLPGDCTGATWSAIPRACRAARTAGGESGEVERAVTRLRPRMTAVAPYGMSLR